MEPISALNFRENREGERVIDMWSDGVNIYLALHCMTAVLFSFSLSLYIYLYAGVLLESAHVDVLCAWYLMNASTLLQSSF
jgi:hypothetical protein